MSRTPCGTAAESLPSEHIGIAKRIMAATWAGFLKQLKYDKNYRSSGIDRDRQALAEVA